MPIRDRAIKRLCGAHSLEAALGPLRDPASLRIDVNASHTAPHPQTQRRKHIAREQQYVPLAPPLRIPGGGGPRVVHQAFHLADSAAQSHRRPDRADQAEN